MLKVIIFDFDGVIVDTFELAYSISSKINKGLTREEYKEFFDGNVYSHPKVSAEVSNVFYIEQEKLFRDLVIKEHIKEELVKLKEKYKLFIITSNREDQLEGVFERSNLVGLFDDVLGLETDKSKVVKFNMIFEKHPVDECIFVTDTVGDIKEGHAVGIKTIAVDYGFHDRSRLEKVKPHAIVSSFEEIHSLLH